MRLQRPECLYGLPDFSAFPISSALPLPVRHGIIAAHGISEYPERHRSLGTSATSPSPTPPPVNGSAPARATARQRRTQTRNRLGRLRVWVRRCRAVARAGALPLTEWGVAEG